MSAGKQLLLVVSVFLSLQALSYAQSDQSAAAPTERSLGDVARETREHHLVASTHPQSKKVLEIVGELQSSTREEYVDKILTMLSKQDFEGLEDTADRARSSRSRFPGGVWKLFVFYDTLGRPAQGKAAADSDWERHLAILKEWTTRKPGSITAHIALAEAYLSRGWKERGSGYADTVSDQGWQSFGARSDLAAAELRQAALLPEKCPHYYFAMMRLALAQGWSKSAARALLEQSLSFESGYYHVYREYAVYLQTKWYGQPGEAERFAEWIAAKLSGDEGKFVYFEIASVLDCGCGNSTQIANLSWPNIKEGYSALERSYGTSEIKMNRFALMAYLNNDKPAAQNILKVIGEGWDPETWRSRKRFDTARNWAMQ